MIQKHSGEKKEGKADPSTTAVGQPGAASGCGWLSTWRLPHQHLELHRRLTVPLFPAALSSMHAKYVFSMRLKSQQNLQSPQSR